MSININISIYSYSMLHSTFWNHSYWQQQQQPNKIKQKKPLSPTSWQGLLPSPGQWCCFTGLGVFGNPGGALPPNPLQHHWKMLKEPQSQSQRANLHLIQRHLARATRLFATTTMWPGLQEYCLHSLASNSNADSLCWQLCGSSQVLCTAPCHPRAGNCFFTHPTCWVWGAYSAYTCHRAFVKSPHYCCRS